MLAFAGVAFFFSAGGEGENRLPDRAGPLADAVTESLPFWKGVNFTAERPAPYGSEAAAETLDRLPEYGINAIALVPYAAGRLGSPEIRFPLDWERDEGVESLARQAHALGLRVMLKPQVWVRGGFPGHLTFDSAVDRRRFFENYRKFVRHYAALAERIDADLFCVGVEFAELTRDENEWRELFALAREHYQGPLTYAANFGDEFERVAFWDDLDYIGLDNYYPLPDDLSTEAIVAKIAHVAERFQKPVLFTEAGFAAYEHTHHKPWEDEPGGAPSGAAQARAYEATFRGFYGEPWLHGIFWWKVGTNGFEGRTPAHSPWGRPAMEVMGRWYTSDQR